MLPKLLHLYAIEYKIGNTVSLISDETSATPIYYRPTRPMRGWREKSCALILLPRRDDGCYELTLALMRKKHLRAAVNARLRIIMMLNFSRGCSV